MFKVKVINISKAPEWCKRSYKNGDVFEVSDTFALYCSKLGAVKLIEHFRYRTKSKKPCPTCGKTIIERERVVC